MCTERFTPTLSISALLLTNINTSTSVHRYCLWSNQERCGIFWCLFESMRECHDLRSLMTGKSDQKRSLFCASLTSPWFYMLIKSLEKLWSSELNTGTPKSLGGFFLLFSGCISAALQLTLLQLFSLGKKPQTSDTTFIEERWRIHLF